MNFNFGNLVSAAVGAVSKVANLVSSTAKGGGLFGGIAGAFTGVAKAVIGAVMAVANVREDGEFDEDEIEEILANVVKAYVGACMAMFGSSSLGSESYNEDKNSGSDKSIGAMFNKSWNSIKGIGSDFWDEAKNRNDSAYDYINWLSIGTADMVKETFDPEDPLSKEHWKNSFGLVSIIFGMRGTKSGIRKSRMIDGTDNPKIQIKNPEDAELKPAIKGGGNRLESLLIDSKQLGKKWGKHKTDYPDMKNFNEYKDFCNDMFKDPEKIVFDKLNDEYLYIRGNDLLRVKSSGEFISVYPGSSTSRVINAIEEGGTIWEQP